LYTFRTTIVGPLAVHAPELQRSMAASMRVSAAPAPYAPRESSETTP
jgi:hypothetical protein